MKKIGLKLKKIGLDGLLVTAPCDIRYLTGFHSDGVMLIVLDSGEILYFTNSMNLTLVEKALSGKRVKIVSGSRVVSETVTSYIKSARLKKIGINPQEISLSTSKDLSKRAPKARFLSSAKGVETSSILYDLRQIKSPDEISLLRIAAKKTVRIWSKVKRKIHTGMTEKEIGKLVDMCILDAGCTNSFPTIAAAGENTAHPHAVPTERRLKKNEHVLVDFGLRYKGYCSDLTRTWDNGRIDGQIRDFRKLVLKAQKAAIKMIKPGVMIGTLARESYNILNIGGKGEFILHGLGHGVGLEVHERPFLSMAATERLKKGMVITVEPGLYKEGLGGVREEDMVVVTEKGCEVLTV